MAVEFLPGLPLSINEKVDRTRLRRLAATVRGGSGEEAPTARTGTAALIAARWCARLDVADVADDADFFELGGNSIMAARVSRDISRELGVPVPVGMLFDAPTLGEFTNAVTRLSRAS